MSLLAGAGAGEMPPPPYAEAEPACLLVWLLFFWMMMDDVYDEDDYGSRAFSGPWPSFPSLCFLP